MEKSLLSLLSLILLTFLNLLHAQQSYLNNAQLDCYKNVSSTFGYVCNSSQSQTPCSSFLTFRSTSLYDSPVMLGYLFNSDSKAIAQSNNISSEVDKIPINTQITIPVNCSCTGRFYQYNSSYTLKIQGETYFSLANNTYEGLTTCQALIAQNPYVITNLSVGMEILVPLRCACPSSSQTSDGVKFLLSYLVKSGDDVSKIAQMFGVTERSVLDANELDASDTIFPFTPLLIPLKKEPTPNLTTAVSSPPPASPPPPQTAVLAPSNVSASASEKKKWVFVGVGIGFGVGVGFLVLALCGVVLVRFSRRKREKPVFQIPKEEGKVQESQEESLGYGFSQGVRDVLESLAVYKIKDLQLATEYFSENCRIRGSVYRAVINGDHAAVKRMKGDVSNEINILKQISHSNVIRLSGFCLHEGNTYLVYEYAENGSLSDWLHEKKHQTLCLSWKQRMQIAYDAADGLNYLHNYANPQYIHKDLKSSNILLDGNFRAKVANFGLARVSQEEDGSGGMQITRHVVGTQGYMAPEYLEHGLVTPKLDVFALGVVMLELLSGREAATAEKEGEGKGDLPLWASIGTVLEGENVRVKLRGFMDPCLQRDYPFELAFAMAQLAMKCVAHDPSFRPSIIEVFVSLSKILSSSLDWDPSDGSKSSSVVVLGR